jgi:hypothetical protein
VKTPKINHHCWENLKTYMCTIHCMNCRFLTTAQCYCNTNLHGTSHVHTARVLSFKFLRFEILTAVFLEIQVFRDITQGCQKITATTLWRIIIPSPSGWSSPQTLTMYVLWSFETSGTTRPMRECCIPEKLDLQSNLLHTHHYATNA